MAQEIRKYFVKGSWIFNLESMHDKLWVLENDLEEHRMDFPFEVAGKTINNFDDLDALRDEAAELEWRAKAGKVTGKEYGRIKAIVEWRVMVRYNRCLASGMDEQRAGMCFTDM